MITTPPPSEAPQHAQPFFTPITKHGLCQLPFATCAVFVHIFLAGKDLRDDANPMHWVPLCFALLVDHPLLPKAIPYF